MSRPPVAALLLAAGNGDLAEFETILAEEVRPFLATEELDTAWRTRVPENVWSQWFAGKQLKRMPVAMAEALLDTMGPAAQLGRTLDRLITNEPQLWPLLPRLQEYASQGDWWSGIKTAIAQGHRGAVAQMADAATARHNHGELVWFCLGPTPHPEVLPLLLPHVDPDEVVRHHAGANYSERHDLLACHVDPLTRARWVLQAPGQLPEAERQHQTEVRLQRLNQRPATTPMRPRRRV